MRSCVEVLQPDQASSPMAEFTADEEEAFIDENDAYEAECNPDAEYEFDDDEGHGNSDDDIDMEGGDNAIISDAAIELDIPAFYTKTASDSVCCISVHPQFPAVSNIAIGSCDNACRIYQLGTRSLNEHDSSSEGQQLPGELTLVKTLLDSGDTIACVSYSKDGKYLATGSLDSIVRIYKVASKRETAQGDTGYRLLHTLEGPSADIEWLEWHPKGPAIAAGSADCSVWVWMATSGTVIQVLNGHGGRVIAGCFAGNGKVLCTGGEDGCVIIWEIETGRKLHKFGKLEKPRDEETNEKVVPGNAVLSMAIHTNSTLLATGSVSGLCRLINVENGKQIAVLSGHRDSVESLAFWDDSHGQLFGPQTILASGSMDGVILIWDCSRMVIRYKFEQDANSLDGWIDAGGITRVAWLPCSPGYIISTSTNGNVCIWDCRKNICKQTLRAHAGTVLDVKITAVSKEDSSACVITAGDDMIANMWIVPIS